MPLARGDLFDEIFGKGNRSRLPNFDAVTGKNGWTAETRSVIRQHQRWARDIVSGVQHMHDQKFIHRDLKPENILVSQDGVAQIADLGMTRNYYAQVPSSYGRSPDFVGTLVYDAPELLCLNYNYTSAVDWWACGWIFFELFFGIHPLQEALKSPEYSSYRNNETAGARTFIHSKIAWPSLFVAQLKDSYLQRLDRSTMTPNEWRQYTEQKEVLRIKAKSQPFPLKLIYQLLGDKGYEAWETYYKGFETTAPTRERKETKGEEEEEKDEDEDEDDEEEDEKKEEEKREREENEEGFWDYLAEAISSMLQMDPTKRIPKTRDFLLDYPERPSVPPRIPTRPFTENEFEEYSDLGVTKHTMELATRVWQHLNQASSSSSSRETRKPDELPRKERDEWRLATLSLAAKGLEDDFPQLDRKRFSPQKRLRVSKLGDRILIRIGYDLWEGMLRPLLVARSKLFSSNSSSSSSSSLSSRYPS